jgi:hypothetical protein
MVAFVRSGGLIVPSQLHQFASILSPLSGKVSVFPTGSVLKRWIDPLPEKSTPVPVEPLNETGPLIVAVPDIALLMTNGVLKCWTTDTCPHCPSTVK